MATLETFLDQTNPLERRRLELRQRREQLEFDLRRKMELEGRVTVARVDSLGQMMQSLEEMSQIAKARNDAMRGRLDDITNSIDEVSRDTQLRLERTTIEHYKDEYLARMKSWWPQWREEVERHKVRQVHEYEAEAARAEARRRLASLTFEKEKVLAETVAKRKQALQAVTEAERREALAREVERKRIGEEAKEAERQLGEAARDELRAAAERSLASAHEQHRERMGRIQEELRVLMERSREDAGRRGEADEAARRRQAELLRAAESALREAGAEVARQAASPAARDSLAADLAAVNVEDADVPGVSLQAARAAEARRRESDLVDAERSRVDGAIEAKRAELLRREREHQELLKRLRESEEREARVRRALQERTEREARLKQELDAKPASPTKLTPDRRRLSPELRIDEAAAASAEDERERARREAEAAGAAKALEEERRRREAVEAEAARLRRLQAEQVAALERQREQLQAQLAAEREAQRRAAAEAEEERRRAARAEEERRRVAAEAERKRVEAAAAAAAAAAASAASAASSSAAGAAAAAAALPERRLSSANNSHQASTSTLHGTTDSNEERKKKVSWKFWKKGKKKGETTPPHSVSGEPGVPRPSQGSVASGPAPDPREPSEGSPSEDPTSERSLASSGGAQTLLSPSGLPMHAPAAGPQAGPARPAAPPQPQAPAPSGPLLSAVAQGLAPAELLRAVAALSSHLERAARKGEARLLAGQSPARMRDEMIRRAAGEGRAEGFAVEACSDALLDCLRSFPDGVLSPEFLQRRVLAQPPGTATLADFTRSAAPTAAALLGRALDLANGLAARGVAPAAATLARLAPALVPDRLPDKRAALPRVASYLEDCARERAQAPSGPAPPAATNPSPVPAPAVPSLSQRLQAGAAVVRRASAGSYGVAGGESSGESDEEGPPLARFPAAAPARPAAQPSGSVRSAMAAQLLRGRSLVELEDDEELEGELAASVSARSFPRGAAAPAGGPRASPRRHNDDDEFG